MKKIIGGIVIIVFAWLIVDNSSAFDRSETEDDAIENLDADQFKKKVFDYATNTTWKFDGDLPVIVDFYADWCKPCRMVYPTLVELQSEYEGKIKIYKVNTQYNKDIAQAFGISGIPAFLFIPKEGKPQMATGALPKEEFEGYIKSILKIEK